MIEFLKALGCTDITVQFKYKGRHCALALPATQQELDAVAKQLKDNM